MTFTAPCGGFLEESSLLPGLWLLRNRASAKQAQETALCVFHWQFYCMDGEGRAGVCNSGVHFTEALSALKCLLCTNSALLGPWLAWSG